MKTLRLFLIMQSFFLSSHALAQVGCEFEAKIEPYILCEDNQRDITHEDGVAAGGISDTQPNTEGDVYRAMGNP